MCGRRWVVFTHALRLFFAPACLVVLSDKNDACLKLMRSYIPSDIKDLVAETLAKKVASFMVLNGLRRPPLPGL
jgi:hypothetical protein